MPLIVKDYLFQIKKCFAAMQYKQNKQFSYLLYIHFSKPKSTKKAKTKSAVIP